MKVTGFEPHMPPVKEQDFELRLGNVILTASNPFKCECNM